MSDSVINHKKSIVIGYKFYCEPDKYDVVKTEKTIGDFEKVTHETTLTTLKDLYNNSTETIEVRTDELLWVEYHEPNANAILRKFILNFGRRKSYRLIHKIDKENTNHYDVFLISGDIMESIIND